MYKGCGAGRSWDISAGVGSKVRLRLRQVAEAVKMGNLQTEPFKAKQGGYLTLNVNVFSFKFF